MEFKVRNSRNFCDADSVKQIRRSNRIASVYNRLSITSLPPSVLYFRANLYIHSGVYIVRQCCLGSKLGLPFGSLDLSLRRLPLAKGMRCFITTASLT